MSAEPQDLRLRGFIALPLPSRSTEIMMWYFMKASDFYLLDKVLFPSKHKVIFAE